MVQEKGAVILNYSNWPKPSPAFYALIVPFDFSHCHWLWSFIHSTSPEKGLSVPEIAPCVSLICTFSSWSIPDHAKVDVLEKPPREKIQVFPPFSPRSSSHLFFLWFGLWAVSSLQPSKLSRNSACGLLSFCATLCRSSQEKTVISVRKKARAAALSAWLVLFPWDVGRCSARATAHSSLQFHYGHD